jgi:hypothetical protein
MLKIATDPRCSIGLDAIRDRLTVIDLLDLVDTLDVRDSLEARE